MEEYAFPSLEQEAQAHETAYSKLTGKPGLEQLLQKERKGEKKFHMKEM